MTLSVIAEYEFTQKDGAVFREEHCIAKFGEDEDRPGIFYPEDGSCSPWTLEDIEFYSRYWIADYIEVALGDSSELSGAKFVGMVELDIELGLCGTREYITKPTKLIEKTK